MNLRMLIAGLADAYLFPLLQLVLVLFGVFCLVLEQRLRNRAGGGGVSLEITRSSDSMAVFYGLYAALTGVFVSLSLVADVAKDHRVLFVLLDVAIIAYVCLLNPWFRNKLIGWTETLKKLEKR